LQELKKVTRIFLIVLLALLIAGLAFTAKHGQFESPTEHSNFLSKTVKMESAFLHPSVPIVLEMAPSSLRIEALYLMIIAVRAPESFRRSVATSLPLLV
jgi:hypothetical protein